MPPVPSELFGVNAADRAWVDAKCTPQPFACLAERLYYTGAHERITDRTYVVARGWGPSPFQPICEQLKAQPGWTIHELPCGHDVMVDMPADTAAILLAVANSTSNDISSSR